jgi:hypothetical protein
MPTTRSPPAAFAAWIPDQLGSIDAAPILDSVLKRPPARDSIIGARRDLDEALDVPPAVAVRDRGQAAGGDQRRLRPS